MSENHVDPFELYGVEITNFVSAMAYKLRRNAHKGKWEDMTVSDAVARIRDELKELEEAIASGSSIDILMEAADLANFAMIASEIARRKAAAQLTKALGGSK